MEVNLETRMTIIEHVI